MRKIILALVMVVMAVGELYAAAPSFDQIAFVGRPRRLHLEGPANQVYGSAYKSVQSSTGVIYYLNMYNPGVWAIDSGMVYRVAGTERRGDRDGPAELAQFDGASSGYPSVDIAIDALDNLFISDGNNGKVRKLYKDGSNKWQVVTFAGSKTGTILTLGGSTGLLNVDLSGIAGIAVDSNGLIWVNRSRMLIKLDPVAETATAVLQFPADCAAGTGTYIMNSNDMAADSVGNVYGIGAPSQGLWKYSVADGYTRLTCYDRAYSPGTYDGALETASMSSELNIVAVPDGSRIYFGGGDDEGNFRKIEDGRVKSLMENGDWSELAWTARSTAINAGGPQFVDSSGDVYVSHDQYTQGTTTLRKLKDIP